MRRLPLLFAALLTLFATSARAADRPHLLLFIADDMAWNDCGAYGHPHIRTPNIDRLAKQGMRFDNAFLTCSSCSPSRSSIITGRYPHATGGAHQLHRPLPGDQVTFVERLKAAGYHTVAAGKWHLGNATKPKFDVVTGLKQMVPSLRERPRNKPFFGWYAFSDPHRGYQKNTIPEPHTGKDAVVPPFLPDVPATRNDLAMYYDEITRLDGVVGECLDVLEEQGIADDTLVLFISDNGRPFPRCKTTVFDSGVKTPFVVRWPREVEADSVTESLVSSVDIAPTFLDLAGVEIPETCQGRSFAKVLRDPQQTIRDYVFAEHNWHDFEDHQRAVRDGRFKYIRNAYTDIPLTPPADAVRSPTYRAMLELHAEGELNRDQRQCFTVPRAKEELYDLERDPYELTNVAADAQYRDALNRMRAELDDWAERTEDFVPDERRADEFDRKTGRRLQR